MSIHLPNDVSTVLADAVRIMCNDHGESCVHPASAETPCATCELIERARQVTAAPSSDPDVALFAALEAAGASDTVSNIVDDLEDAILLAAPVLKVNPRAVLRAVIVTAQQRLDWGYGPIGGAHAGAAPAPGDRAAHRPTRQGTRATPRGRRPGTRRPARSQSRRKPLPRGAPPSTKHTPSH